MTSNMTFKISVNMTYFCKKKLVINAQLSFVRQRSFENAHFPNIFLGRSSYEDLSKTFRQEI